MNFLICSYAIKKRKEKAWEQGYLNHTFTLADWLLQMTSECMGLNINSCSSVCLFMCVHESNVGTVCMHCIGGFGKLFVLLSVALEKLFGLVNKCSRSHHTSRRTRRL